MRPFVIILLATFAVAQGVTAQDKPLPPQDSAAAWKLPPGFSATLFAGEPDLVQPMSFTFDDRGRIWVVEALTYPTWSTTGGKGRDRVTIFEDTDGDGRHDKRTVFLDDGLNLSSVEVGFGGVWLTAVPNLLFIPDKNGDDRPDGPPQVLLDGFDLGARHNVVGNLAWGPDGWLYGLNGILSNSNIGKPGTPDAKRIPINCGVWRYHPVRHEVEAYAHGTTNPWGIDWDERGQMFITNCVIKHIFHVMPGAHFTRMYGQDLNPHVYGLVESCADHQHWAGGHWTSSRGGQGAHGDAGGGHAHSGCMIYLGDNWPDEYRGDAFMVNLHGQRLNRDKLVPTGSTYVAQHAPDFAFSKDPWFRGIHVKYGPDGGVYVSDWSDTGECHDHKSEEECDKTGGRIFKIVYGEAKRPPHGDLSKLSDVDLVSLQSHKNEWFARHSRRILQERSAAGTLERDSLKRLDRYVEDRVGSAVVNLRALFTQHACGAWDATKLSLLFNGPRQDPNLAAVAIILATESGELSPETLAELQKISQSETTPFMRLHLAAALQRIPKLKRRMIVRALTRHQADANDPYLSLMYWYAIEQSVAALSREGYDLLHSIDSPQLAQFTTRRLLAIADSPDGAKSRNANILHDLVHDLIVDYPVWFHVAVGNGLCDAFRGRDAVKMPSSWPEAYRNLAKSPDGRLRELAAELGVYFGDQNVIALMRKIVKDVSREPATRLKALHILSGLHDPKWGKELIGLLDEEPMRADVIRVLAMFDLTDVPSDLVARYAELPTAQRLDVIQTLTARPAFALTLLDAIETGKIPRQDVSALVIRQLQSLDDKAVNERLAKVWGEVRPAAAEKKERVAKFKEQLKPETLAQADLPRGRYLYVRSCAGCHKLFDEGGVLAPELTGSQRANLDYILDNVLDPSAIVPRDYRVQILRLADGRTVQGVVVEETPHALAVRTANDLVRVPVGEIEARKDSPLSMMPEGLFDRLSPDEIRDLVGYLASPQQVPLPAGGK